MEGKRRITDISKEVQFPNEFYSFADGVDIDDPQINIWIQEAFESLRLQILEDPEDGHHSYVASGNTIVILWAYPKGNGTYDVTVTISKNYSVYDIFDFDPLVDEGFTTID